MRFNLTVDEIKQEGDNIQTTFNVVAHTYDNIKGNILVLSGCEDDETSADAWINRQSQGAMTHSFLEALKMSNYNLDYEQLMTNIYQVIKTNKFNQNPTMSSNKSIYLKINSNYKLKLNNLYINNYV